MGRPHRHPNGHGVPASPKFLGPLTWAHAVRETTTKICTVIELDAMKVFTESTTDLLKTCDLFPLANLLGLYLRYRRN